MRLFFHLHYISLTLYYISLILYYISLILCYILHYMSQFNQLTARLDAMSHFRHRPAVVEPVSSVKRPDVAAARCVARRDTCPSVALIFLICFLGSSTPCRWQWRIQSCWRLKNTIVCRNALLVRWKELRKCFLFYFSLFCFISLNLFKTNVNYM